MRKGMLLLFILGFAGSLLGMQSSQSASGNGNPAAELLMKGMQAEDLSGNLGEAVRYYSQAVNTPTDQRVYAAYAQLRLAQISLERGDLAGAVQQFEVLKRDYADYADLVAVTVAQDHTNVFHGNAPQPALPGQIGYKRGGRYHHVLTGMEIDLIGWNIAAESDSTGGGQMVTLLKPGSQAQLSIWLRPDQIPTADLPLWLRGSVQQKILQRMRLQNYSVRPESIQPMTVRGKHGMVAIADFVEEGTPMIEYLTWIYTEKTRAFFFTRVKAAEFQRLRPSFDQVITSAAVP